MSKEAKTKALERAKKDEKHKHRFSKGRCACGMREENNEKEEHPKGGKETGREDGE